MQDRLGLREFLTATSNFVGHIIRSNDGSEPPNTYSLPEIQSTGPSIEFASRIAVGAGVLASCKAAVIPIKAFRWDVSVSMSRPPQAAGGTKQNIPAAVDYKARSFNTNRHLGTLVRYPHLCSLHCTSTSYSLFSH